MYDKELVTEILNQTLESTQKIILRFTPIKTVNDFTNSPAGMEKLDSICMQLIAIGESIKNIDKITNNILLINYPEVDWKGIKGLRDIITHQYFDIDAEQIFLICQRYIQPLAGILRKIINDQNLDHSQ
jgi:uncharacterized protein with HEPN domain